MLIIFLAKSKTVEQEKYVAGNFKIIYLKEIKKIKRNKGIIRNKGKFYNKISISDRL